MILFRDLFTGKDILTDSYNMKLIDDFVYEVQASYCKVEDNCDDELIGGKPSAEPTSKSGFDVILSHEDLEEYHEQLTLQQFLRVMKHIIRFAETKIPKDRVEKVFKPKMAEFFKEGIGKKRFSKFQIFFSKDCINLEDGNIEAAPVLLDADDTGMKAKVYYFKDLMVEE